MAVRGRYTQGRIGGEEVAAYTEEPGVDAARQTETFAAMRLHIDNWRWQDVPFYLRTGKRMRRKLTQIVVCFRSTPHTAFRDVGLPANRLVMNVQPEEGISLWFVGKVPGQGMHVRTAQMDFDYAEQFGGHPPDSYAQLLIDAMRGDQSLFKSRHEVEAAWRVVDPVLARWSEPPETSLHGYPAGSWGPEAAEAIFEGRGRWHNPEPPPGGSTRGDVDGR